MEMTEASKGAEKRNAKKARLDKTIQVTRFLSVERGPVYTSSLARTWYAWQAWSVRKADLSRSWTWPVKYVIRSGLKNCFEGLKWFYGSFLRNSKR